MLALLHLLPAATPMAAVLFEAASAQGNVGLPAGITSPELPLAAKLVVMAQMWLGRLGIFPALALLAWAVAWR